MKNLGELLDEREAICYALTEADGETYKELERELHYIEIEIERAALPIGESNDCKISG